MLAVFRFYTVFELVHEIVHVLLACGQNFVTSMKCKALCHDYDIDISRRFVSCQYLHKLVYDKFQMVVHARLSYTFFKFCLLSLAFYFMFMVNKHLN